MVKALKIQKMDLLVGVYMFCIVAAELMGGKVFPIGSIFGYPLRVSVAIFLVPVIFSINDVITEVYGKERTRSIIRSGIAVVALVFLFTMLATNLPASVRVVKEANYDAVFHVSSRIAAASLTAFAISEFLDVKVFVKIREKLGKGRLWLRTNVSNIIAQLVDTVLFMTLAFYSLGRPFADNFDFLLSLILPYWLLKCFMSVIETPFVYLGVKWLKRG